MAITKVTLAKEHDDGVEYLYPKTSSDIVAHKDKQGNDTDLNNFLSDINNIPGTLDIENGGTGATTGPNAIHNLTSGKIEVNNDNEVDINANAVISGTTTSGDKLTVESGGAEIDGGLVVTSGDIEATGNNIKGNTLQSINGTTVGNKLTVTSGGADITGDTTIDGTTTSTGKLTISNGGADIKGDVNIDGATTSTGKLTVNNGGADITGNTTIDGTTTSTGKLTVNNGGAYINGDVSITGNTSFSNPVTLNDKLTINNGGADIKGDVNIDGTINGLVPYASCSTAAATAAKAVTVNGTYTLSKGARVVVKFTATNTASNPTLNVNSTGARPIYYKGSAITAGYLAANRTYMFIYNGTQYDFIGDANTHPSVYVGPTYAPVNASMSDPYVSFDSTTGSYTGFRLIGDGATTVTSDANHNITISSTDTDTKVTSSANHYTPKTNSNSNIEASASGATAAWSIDVVKGVTLNTDGKGHVTGIEVASGKIPANPNTDTKVTNTLGTTTKAYVTGTSSATTNTGTQYFDTGVYLENTAGNFHVEGTINGLVPYASCSTAAGTAAKEVTVNGTYKLSKGARVIVKFSNTNSAANPTLNVNSTGAKAIYYRNSAISAGYLAANRTYMFIYNGTQYDLVGDIDTNSTYSSKSAASGGTDLSLVTTGEKYTWNNKSNLTIGTTSSTAAAGNHKHDLSIVTDTSNSNSNLTMAANSKYKLTAGGNSYIFTTPPNATQSAYSIACTGMTNPDIANIILKKDNTNNSTVTLHGTGLTSVTKDGNGMINIYSSIETLKLREYFEMSGNSNVDRTRYRDYTYDGENKAHCKMIGFSGGDNESDEDYIEISCSRLNAALKDHKHLLANVTMPSNGTGTPTKTDGFADGITLGLNIHQARKFESGKKIGTNSTVLGYPNSNLIESNDSCIIGKNNTTSDNAASSFILGEDNSASAHDNYTIGHHNSITSNNTYILGSNNNTSGTNTDGCVMLGRYNKMSGVARESLVAGNGNIRILDGSNDTNNKMTVNVYLPNSTSLYTKNGQTDVADLRGHSLSFGFFNTTSSSHTVSIGTDCHAGDIGSFVCGMAPNTGYDNDTTLKSARSIYGQTIATRNKAPNSFIVGNGGYVTDNGTTHPVTYNTTDAIYIHTFSHSNAFRVDCAGNVYGGNQSGTFNSGGADYAEFIKEWWDGNPDNEDRVGYMVTIGEDGKLHKANAGDYIIGITSGRPSVVGNSDEEYFWRYERDKFNRIIQEEVTVLEDEEQEDGTVIKKEVTYTKPKEKADYDSSRQNSYIERKYRPEWDYVGMRGVVPCRDDGTCVARGFCKCGANGIATKADTRGFDTYYVIERIDDETISVEVR